MGAEARNGTAYLHVGARVQRDAGLWPVRALLSFSTRMQEQHHDVQHRKGHA